MPTLFILILSLLFVSPLRAETAEVSRPPPQTPEQAEAERQQAAAMRKAAEEAYSAEKAGCYQKIQVNACLEDARKRYMSVIIEARKIDVQARTFERELRRDEAEAKSARRADERSTREAAQQKRAERYRAREKAKAVEREQKQQENERKAEERRKKRARRKAEKSAGTQAEPQSGASR